MKIATIQEVNTLGCCGCNLPECDAPRKECESIHGEGQIAFVVYDSVTGIYYRRTRDDYSDGGFRQYEAPSTHWTTLGGVDIEPYHVDFTEGDPKTGTLTTTNSIPISIADSRSDSLTAMELAIDWDTMEKSNECAFSRFDFDPRGGFPAIALVVNFVRYRFGIPVGYDRSIWEMQWDEGFFPRDWIDWDTGGRIGPEPIPSPSLVTSRSWTWDGSGDFSEWFNIEPPNDSGEVRVVNVITKCWKSTRLGVKPTVNGEIYKFE